STINQTHEIYEISSDTEDTVEQKHAQLYHILNEAQRILAESKVLHNCQKFLDNFEEKLSPLENLVEDVL
ncbi:3657_t:CDS:2, partial [Racocetra persica]